MAALRLCVLETSGSRSGDGGDAGRDPRPDSSPLRALRSHHPSGPPCPRSRALQAGVAGWEAPVCSAPFLPGLCQDAATANENQEAVWECEPTSLPCLEKGLTLTEAAGRGGAEGLCHPPPGRGSCLEPQLPPAKRPGEPSGLCGHSDKPRHEVACDPGLHSSGHLHGMAGARGSGAPCPGRPGRDLAGSRRTPSRPLWLEGAMVGCAISLSCLQRSPPILGSWGSQPGHLDVMALTVIVSKGTLPSLQPQGGATCCDAGSGDHQALGAKPKPTDR